MKRILLAGLALILVLVTVVLVRTLMFTPPAHEARTPVALEIDRERVAQRLAEAIRFRTISRQAPDAGDIAAFEAFKAWFGDTYADALAVMRKEEVAGHTLLLTWPGTDAAAQPVLLTAHYDVVPVIPGTEEDWQHPPFAGDIVDGVVWGRGALDDKGALVAIMEAVSLLVEQGFTPRQTVYFSFGHDEEIGGEKGAAGVAALLAERGIQLDWSLDEGSFILDGLIPGVTKPVAMINVAEKGYVTLDIIAHAEGGHSSLPPQDTAVTRLARALVQLSRSPVPGGLNGVTGEAYESIARHMPFTQRMAFANQWLFGGLVESMLTRLPAGNAMLRTTTAPTMLSASIKENVLPITATATVNFRLHPRDTVEGLVEHVTRAINDERVEVVARRGTPASPVARTDTQGFNAMATATRQMLGDVVITPGLTVAGTDSKHYGKVADNAYRFHPFIVGPADISTVHGTNEKLSVDNLMLGTGFYMHLLTSLAPEAVDIQGD
ncbi:M20 family peptidase [Pyruvatibacter mobilis]|uniref:M20 family peptidase n=1 Tax=Pyruvatibacter mobilis TaxID=1712261 RepID=UPI003BB1AB84